MYSEEIDNYIPIRSNRTQFEINDQVIIEKLFNIIYPEDKFDEFSKKAIHIALITSELYSCHKSSYNCIAYSRSKNDYSLNSGSVESALSYITTIRIIDTLALEGYIHNSNGFYDKKNKANCRSSRMRANTKLVELIESVITPEGLYLQLPLQSLNNYIYLNDLKIDNVNEDIKTKKIEYQINDLTNEWNRTLEMYNQLLSISSITSDSIPRRYMNPDKTIVIRTFSNYSLSLGGRFYGAWWIKCKSKYRKFITINNDKTVEIDYKAMHPTIAYALHDIDYYNQIGPDPYDIDTIKDCVLHRDLIKNIVVKSLGCKNRKQLNKIIQQMINFKEISNNTDYPLDLVIDLCFAHHHRISSFLLTDSATLLQYHESTIAYDIIKHFTNLGIPILTIHDSFICQEQYKDDLNEFMIQRFKDVFGVKILTKII